jgi:hypothetical protein
VVERQRLSFHDEAFLEFHLVIDEELVGVEYGFHYQNGESHLIWRKDKHPGHEELGGLEHIHDDPRHPERARQYREVEMDEVIDEVLTGSVD